MMRFSHLSVQEYLEGRNGDLDPIIDAHLLVAESCLWVLQDPHIAPSPNYLYIALNWFKHCRSYQDLVLQVSVSSNKSSKYKLDIPLLNSYLGSFRHASSSYCKWHDWLLMLDPSDIPQEKELADLCDAVLSSEPISPTFIAAFSGLGESVSWLWLCEDCNAKIQNKKGASLLEVAAQDGSSWVVERILAQGYQGEHGNLSDNDLMDIQSHFGNAVVIAAGRGYRAIVTLLLDRGANINHRCHADRSAEHDLSFGSPLSAASFEGHTDIVTLLLGRGADTNMISGNYGTALVAASFGGHADIVTLLLDQGANINTVGGDFGTALATAAAGKHADIVTLLLDRGADIKTVGGDFGTALATAAAGGCADIVTLLLDRGADINMLGSKYGTALATASFGGYVDIATLLLDRGADINTVCGDLGTALVAAIAGKRADMVTLLLDRGADISTVGGNFGTALAAAAAGRCTDIVTLLLDKVRISI